MSLPAIIKGVSARKKFLLLGGLIFILILGLGVGGFRWWSHREFERFAQSIENLRQKEMSVILATDELEKEFKEEFDAIVFKETGNLANNKKHLTRTEEIHDEIYEKIEDEYLPLIDEKIAEINQFLDRRRYLWLWGDEKKFLDLVVSISEAAARAKTANANVIEVDALLSPATFALQTDTLNYFGFLKTYGSVLPSAAMMTALAPFKKYTTGYKFPNEDSIKDNYLSFYKALVNYRGLYGKIYEMYAAYTSGDYAKAERLAGEVAAISERDFGMTVDLEPINRPLFQGELDAHVNALLAANLYRESKLGEVSFGSRRLAAFALMWATELYALDHDDKYPTADAVTAAVGLLVDGKYLPASFQFDQTTFSGTMGKDKYQISFTDEVTGQEVSLFSTD